MTLTLDWREHFTQHTPHLDQPEVRRLVTHLDPLLFALIYFRHHLTSKETGGRISFSQFHLDLAESAKQWARKDLQPAQVREAWVAPRGSGKSTWLFTILPAWALAHGHRQFISAFAGRAQLAQQHLSTFKQELDTNQLLRRDYPDLCTPARRPAGTSVADRQDMYLSKSKVVFQANGIDTLTLGSKVGTQRPDMLLFDDVEKDEGNYSIHQRDDRLKTILQAVFPMNLNAVVEFAGTTTMYGSIMHDIVRAHVETEAPEWVQDENIQTRYYPAIVTQEDGSEASLWPERWSLEFLCRIRHTANYALNYMNQPRSAEGALWTPDDFFYEPVVGLTHRIISVDPAVTTKTTSDYTGIAVVAYSASEQRCLLEYSAQVKLSPADLKMRLLALIEKYNAKKLLIETTQGGDTWKTILSELPVPIEEIKPSVAKEVRHAQALDYWQNRWVIHDGVQKAFEDQAVVVPKATHDDVVDAVTAGVTYFLKNRKRGPMVRDKQYSYAA